jgi:hypothetical protein
LFGSSTRFFCLECCRQFLPQRCQFVGHHVGEKRIRLLVQMWVDGSG